MGLLIIVITVTIRNFESIASYKIIIIMTRHYELYEELNISVDPVGIHYIHIVKESNDLSLMQRDSCKHVDGIFINFVL